MSIRKRAVAEMRIAGFPQDEIDAMDTILGIFFRHWDSGGAVASMAPVLQRLIAGKPLTPITDTPEQWVDVGHGVLQHVRLPSVFKDPRFHGGLNAYDIDAREPRQAISFPYIPDSAEVRYPVYVVDTSRGDGRG